MNGIATRLCGGLGNQLFQYGAGRALAHLMQGEVVLDLNWYENTPRSNTPRAYELGHYPVRARVATPSEARTFRLIGGRIARRLPWLPGRWLPLRERAFGFDERILQARSRSVYLDGYWQSWRYLEPVADALRSELRPLAAPSPLDCGVAAAIDACESVSIHVRRGDYVSLAAAAQMHGTCTPDYYHRALAYVRERVERPALFVFSDDLGWAKDNLDLGSEATYVSHNGPSTAFQDLALMARCRHHIIANSSFSWWGAWLAWHGTQVVVGPSRWFAGGPETPDLMPTSWVKL